MSDPLTTGAPRAADALSGLERDARVEQLLLQGLDRYFAGDYESAIHVWTRVLFLDRGHQRARAYIERARSAQAERQRESEELLHRGVAAFNRGEAGHARELLREAVTHGAPPEVALSYLGRLDRLDTAPAPIPPPVVEERPADPPPPPPHHPAAARHTWPSMAMLGALTVGVIAVAAWGGVSLSEFADLRAAVKRRAAAPQVAAAPPEEPLPLPRLADLALARARAQFAAGHLAAAQGTLQVIGPFDPVKPDADRLRAEIQRMLLGSLALPGGASITQARAHPGAGAP